MPVLGEFVFEMAFPQDVLGSIVYASQAISREAGIKLDVVGFEPDNPDLPGVKVCTRHLTEAVSNLLDNAVKYAPLRRGGGRKQGKKLVGRPRIPQIRVTLVSNEPPLSPGATLYIVDRGYRHRNETRRLRADIGVRRWWTRSRVADWDSRLQEK
jgi:signal transduction histidine kinase